MHKTLLSNKYSNIPAECQFNGVRLAIVFAYTNFKESKAILMLGVLFIFYVYFDNVTYICQVSSILVLLINTHLVHGSW